MDVSLIGYGCKPDKNWPDKIAYAMLLPIDTDVATSYVYDVRDKCKHLIYPKNNY